MKNKNIGRVLSAMLLLNNFSFDASANSLSEDLRYENFSGNKIAVSEVLEEDNIDVKLEGNTLVNLKLNDGVECNMHWSNKAQDLFTKTKASSTSLNGTINNSAKDLGLSWAYGILGNVNLSLLKPSTTYTLVLDNKYDIFENVFIQAGDATNNYTKGARKVDKNKYIIKTKDSFDGLLEDESVILYGFINSKYTGNVDFEIISLLEGDWSEKDAPSKYFEGMKSVGEVNNSRIKVVSRSRNLFNIDTVVENKYQNHNTSNGNFEISTNNKWKITDYIEVVEGETYYNNLGPGAFYDKDKKPLKHIAATTGQIVVPNKAKYVVLTNWIYSNWDNCVFQLSSISNRSYTPYRLSEKEIVLDEPLRGLPNGVKDRILKKDGKWYVERNYVEITLDETYKWSFNNIEGTTTNRYFVDLRTIYEGFSSGQNPENTLCDKLKTYYWNQHVENGISRTNASIFVYKKDCNTLKEFKDWISENNLTLIIKLETPTYELLKTGPILRLYNELTYISNNSTIPCNMSVTIDRALNIANKYVELAKTSPTIDNLSRARRWVNLLNNSMVKDQLEVAINGILEVSDVTFEKKNATSDLDIYIKSESMLSLSLDTNSIVFDNFSGVEDVVKENAINLTVSSSLPYAISAYLEGEVQNADRSEAMDRGMLNIKENSEVNYKEFGGIRDKLVLKDSCAKGNNISHGIDLKLKGSKAHKADAYKTTIKLEVEQK